MERMMRSIKTMKFYENLRQLKRKYRNYFSDQGLLTRKVYHFISHYDPLVNVPARKAIYNNMLKTASDQIRNVVSTLESKGYCFIQLRDLGIDDTAVIEFCHSMASDFKQNEHLPGYIESLPKSKYLDRTIAYMLYQKKNAFDPMILLATHEVLLTIASLYIHHFPLIEEISMVYNPVHQGKQFGSQLWHRDTQQKRILKLFFSSENINPENGPFQFFPPRLSTPQFYVDLPDGMTDERLSETLDLQCAISFLAKPHQFLLVDTERCLHRGALSQEPRFNCTISYSSPLYSFMPRQYRKTGTYQTSFVNFKEENEKILNQFLKHNEHHVA